jgi:hypothetical protein
MLMMICLECYMLQIKCRAQVSGRERERDVKCEDLERPVEGRRGRDDKSVLSRQSKNDPKRFSIGCMLHFNN